MLTFSEARRQVEDALRAIDWQQHPAGLYAPIDYVLSLGGKRVRPCLALLGADLFGGRTADVMPLALALETFHNFTLLHDDVMDRADMRRGHPTVHVKWNQNTAILSGDTMSLLSFRQLLGLKAEVLPAVLDAFSQMTIEICEGQQLDMDFETRTDVTLDEYMEMIRLKTAVLLAASVSLGALVAGAPEADVKHLYHFGLNLGLAFQLRDDYLDVYGHPDTFGKALGGDILSGKKTYLLLSALEKAGPTEAAALRFWLERTDCPAEDKIRAVTHLYTTLQVPQQCEQAMQHHHLEATQHLRLVQVPEESKSELYALTQQMLGRES